MRVKSEDLSESLCPIQRFDLNAVQCLLSPNLKPKSQVEESLHEKVNIEGLSLLSLKQGRCVLAGICSKALLLFPFNSPLQAKQQLFSMNPGFK